MTQASSEEFDDPTGRKQRRNEAAEMKANGDFSWSWPAFFGMGLWALWHGIWWAMFREFWFRKSTLVIISIIVVLTIPVAVFGPMRATDLEKIMPFWYFGVMMILWLFSLIVIPIHFLCLLGRRGEMWLYIYRGIQPKKTRQ